MDVTLALCLPRDHLSVPLARRILKGSLEVLGFHGDDIADVELAVTEASTNVLDHAAGDDEYEIRAGLHGTTMVIEVIDKGHGFDGSAAGLLDAEPHAEEGRGIQLMRALVDRLVFQNLPTEGTVVHLEKTLRLPPDAPAAQLAGMESAPR